MLSEFDAGVLAATDPAQPLTADEIARQVGHGPLAVKGSIARLRARGLIEDVHARPARFLRTADSEAVLGSAQAVLNG